MRCSSRSQTVRNCYLLPTGDNYKPTAGGSLQLYDVGPALQNEQG